ncbi:MAG: hypothetical protein N3A65_03095 [candidate division WOR-3 bacterium]|nr:hypothetical protein [candidate division WOR-3 bacterium]
MGVRVTPQCDTINTIIISTGPSLEAFPDVAFGDGISLVVWSNSSQYVCKGARVAPSGTIIDTAFIIAQYPFFFYPSVIFVGSKFFVASSGGSQIVGRFVWANGSMSSSTVIATSLVTPRQIRMAFDGTNILVVWVEDIQVLKGCLVSSGTGAPIGNTFTIASSYQLDRYSLGLCFDGIHYCVTYSDSGRIYMRKYTTTGNPIGPAFRISNSNRAQYGCDIISGFNGRYFIAWSENFAGNRKYDIAGNIDWNIGIEEDYNARKSISNYGLPKFSTHFSSFLRLNGLENNLFRVYDAMGKMVKEYKGDCIGWDLKAGVYFLITENRRLKPVKIVKIK